MGTFLQSEGSLNFNAIYGYDEVYPLPNLGHFVNMYIYSKFSYLFLRNVLDRIRVRVRVMVWGKKRVRDKIKPMGTLILIDDRVMFCSQNSFLCLSHCSLDSPVTASLSSLNPTLSKNYKFWLLSVFLPIFDSNFSSQALKMFFFLHFSTQHRPFPWKKVECSYLCSNPPL